MMRKLWWAVSMALAASWIASIIWIVAAGPGPEGNRPEKIMFAILVVASVFAAANPKLPEFRKQLKGALGALMAWAGVAGMFTGLYFMLPSIAYKATASNPENLLIGFMVVVSGAVGVIGLGLYEEHADQSPPGPKPCPE